MVPASGTCIPCRGLKSSRQDERSILVGEDHCRMRSMDPKGLHRFSGQFDARVIGTRPYLYLAKSRALVAAVWCCIVAFAPAAACSRSDSTASGSGGVEAGAVPTSIAPHARMANCTELEKSASQCVYGTCYVTVLDGYRSQPACQCYPQYTGAKCKIQTLPSVQVDAASIYIVLPIVIVIIAVIGVLIACRIRRGHLRFCFTSERRTADNASPGTSHPYVPPGSQVPSNGFSEGDQLLINGKQGSPNGEPTQANMVEIKNTNSVIYAPNLAESQ